MAQIPTLEEAMQRAQRAVDDRLAAVRRLAESRQKVADVREQNDRERAELERVLSERLATAESDDVRSWNATLGAGWTVEELRRIGYQEPEKKRRARNRATRVSTKPGPVEPVQEAHQPDW